MHRIWRLKQINTIRKFENNAFHVVFNQNNYIYFFAPNLDFVNFMFRKNKLVFQLYVFIFSLPFYRSFSTLSRCLINCVGAQDKIFNPHYKTTRYFEKKISGRQNLIKVYQATYLTFACFCCTLKPTQKWVHLTSLKYCNPVSEVLKVPKFTNSKIVVLSRNRVLYFKKVMFKASSCNLISSPTQSADNSVWNYLKTEFYLVRRMLTDSIHGVRATPRQKSFSVFPSTKKKNTHKLCSMK